MSRVNKLTLEWHIDSTRPELLSAEFVIDGVLLREHCERATGKSFGLVSPFGWTSLDYQKEFAERLLFRRPMSLPKGRCPLLVCSLCADLGCGCISAFIESDGDCFLWRDLGHENEYDASSLFLFPMGKFAICQEELERFLHSACPSLIT